MIVSSQYGRDVEGGEDKEAIFKLTYIIEVEGQDKKNQGLYPKCHVKLKRPLFPLSRPREQGRRVRRCNCTV